MHLSTALVELFLLEIVVLWIYF